MTKSKAEITEDVVLEILDILHDKLMACEEKDSDLYDIIEKLRKAIRKEFPADEKEEMSPFMRIFEDQFPQIDWNDHLARVARKNEYRNIYPMIDPYWKNAERYAPKFLPNAMQEQMRKECDCTPRQSKE